jgi:hypothetical protein
VVQRLQELALADLATQRLRIAADGSADNPSEHPWRNVAVDGKLIEAKLLLPFALVQLPRGGMVSLDYVSSWVCSGASITTKMNPYPLRQSSIWSRKMSRTACLFPHKSLTGQLWLC